MPIIVKYKGIQMFWFIFFYSSIDIRFLFRRTSEWSWMDVPNFRILPATASSVHSKKKFTLNIYTIIIIDITEIWIVATFRTIHYYKKQKKNVLVIFIKQCVYVRNKESFFKYYEVINYGLMWSNPITPEGFMIDLITPQP